MTIFFDLLKWIKKCQANTSFYITAIWLKFTNYFSQHWTGPSVVGLLNWEHAAIINLTGAQKQFFIYRIPIYFFLNDEGATWQVNITQVFNYVLIWKLVARFNCFFFSTLSSFWTGFCVATWYKTYDCDFELLVIIRFTFN